MLLPRPRLCAMSGGGTAVLMSVIFAMSSAGLVAIVYLLATSTAGTGNLLDNIRGYTSSNIHRSHQLAETADEPHRGWLICTVDVDAQMAENRLRYAYEDGGGGEVMATTTEPAHPHKSTDKRLMRQRLVHHLLPTAVAPTTQVVAAAVGNSDDDATPSLPHRIKDGDHIYIDADTSDTRRQSTPVAITEAVVAAADTTEDITSIEYFDQIIADHKERSRHRLATAAAARPSADTDDDWAAVAASSLEHNGRDDDGGDDGDDDDDDDGDVAATTTTTSTVRPSMGRSINSRIVAKVDPTAMAGGQQSTPRQLLKQHLQQRKRAGGQRSPQIVQTQAEVLPPPVTVGAIFASSDDEDYDANADDEGSGSGDFQLVPRRTTTTRRPKFESRWWRQQTPQRKHSGSSSRHRGGTTTGGGTSLPPKFGRSAPMNHHIQRLGSNGEPLNVAWQADTRAMRIMGNVRISEERSRQLLLCEEAGGGELCRMLFKGHLVAATAGGAEPSTGSSSGNSGSGAAE